MQAKNYQNTGIGVAILLLLAWPAAYLANQQRGGVAPSDGRLYSLAGPSHGGYPGSQAAECPPSAHPDRSFRMGISPDQAPFADRARL
ncbi:MAG: hypothetical protein H7835_15800 [Magnetococcus sp. XQGC-1]